MISRMMVVGSLWVLLGVACFGQITQGMAWRIENLAGTGQSGFQGDGGLATQAQLDNPFGVIRGPDGNLWFCESIPMGSSRRWLATDGKGFQVTVAMPYKLP
jgi:hypothetical protein